jgi:microcystin-dependent protein
MQGYMAEIRCFAGDFAPKTWALCYGQTMAITTNQALFSLLGTTYGGNGTSTFQLPDLRGRIPLGAGNPSYGGSSFVLGQIGGQENHTLLITEMPRHTHVATVTPSTAGSTISYTLCGTGLPGTLTDPKGDLLASDDGSGSAQVYAPATPAPTLVTMAPDSVTLTNLTPGTPNVTVGITGGNQPHTNTQPVLGMNYIICLTGIFPSRN